MAPGQLADFVAVDLSAPQLAGATGDNLLEHLIFGCSAEGVVHSTCVGGQWRETNTRMANIPQVRGEGALWFSRHTTVTQSYPFYMLQYLHISNNAMPPRSDLSCSPSSNASWIVCIPVVSLMRIDDVQDEELVNDTVKYKYNGLRLRISPPLQREYVHDRDIYCTR